jgi:hypothetical protein
MFTTVILAAVVLFGGGTMGQDTMPCEMYNATTGLGKCNGIAVNIASVICADTFDPSVCKASEPRRDGQGGTTTYFFKVPRRPTLTLCAPLGTVVATFALRSCAFYNYINPHPCQYGVRTVLPLPSRAHRPDSPSEPAFRVTAPRLSSRKVAA